MDKVIPFVVSMITTCDGRQAVNTPSEWRTRSRTGAPVSHGKPTALNLVMYVQQFEASTKPGECNEHLGATKVVSAQITDQRTGTVVATYRCK